MKKLILFVSLILFSLAMPQVLLQAQDSTETTPVPTTVESSTDDADSTTTTTTNTTGSDRKNQLKNRREDIKDQREALQDKRTELLENRQNRIEERKNKVEERKAKIQAKLNERKTKIVEKLQEKMIKINEKRTGQMLAHLDRLGKILDKIQARAAKAKTNGKDTASVDTLIATARTSIVTAKTAVEAQQDKTYQITVTSEGQARNEVGATSKLLQTDLQTVRNLVKAAKDAVQSAIKQLRIIIGEEKVNSNEPIISPATTSAGDL